jgi:8-hydroxy-5-deazaflavin:NADPH oxidoreductase
MGFIGAGNVGQTMARHFINAGHRVVFSNSRGPETLQGLVGKLGPSAKAGTTQEAVQCDLVMTPPTLKWMFRPTSAWQA